MTLHWFRRAVAPVALATASPDDDGTQAQDAADLEVLNRHVEQLNAAGKCAEATELAKYALALAGPAVAKALNNLATQYFVEGRDVDAEPLFERALAILKKALGPDHPAVAAAHHYLVGLRIEQGGSVHAAAYLLPSPEAARSPTTSVDPPLTVVPSATQQATADLKPESAVNP
jgi:tetratricopeptide (TPR) repeat protein